MSLPSSFSTASEYFEEAVKFFRDYHYLYNFTNTQILLQDALDRIVTDGVNIDDLFDAHVNFEDVAMKNEYLRTIFERAEKLSVKYEDIDINSTCNDIIVPLSPKKKHEIEYLAKEIAQSCESVGCTTVVDFGSGLGYLDQHLYDKSNFKILGVESNSDHYNGAKKRQLKYHMDSIENVKYFKHTVKEDSQECIEQKLKEKFSEFAVKSGFCLAGLHVCADLTIDTINLFLKMADAKALVLMSCCYHKMSESEGRFKNFPSSELLKDIFEKYKCCEYLKVQFLRLAAHPPSSTDNLREMVFHLLARAVLELDAHQRKLKITRKKRKAVRMRPLDNNFQLYVECAENNGFTLTCQCANLGTCDCCVEFDKENLTQLWRHVWEKYRESAAIFVLIQRHFQPLFENFILCDRIEYLKERGVNCKMKKIVNENISPRCLALVAYK